MCLNPRSTLHFGFLKEEEAAGGMTVKTNLQKPEMMKKKLVTRSNMGHNFIKSSIHA